LSKKLKNIHIDRCGNRDVVTAIAWGMKRLLAKWRECEYLWSLRMDKKILIHSNPFKWIYLKSNPFNWIIYRFDTFFNPKWILGWILTWPRPMLSRVNSGSGRAKSTWVHVEPSRSGSKSSRFGPGKSQVESMIWFQ